MVLFLRLGCAELADCPTLVSVCGPGGPDLSIPQLICDSRGFNWTFQPVGVEQYVWNLVGQLQVFLLRAIGICPIQDQPYQARKRREHCAICPWLTDRFQKYVFLPSLVMKTMCLFAACCESTFAVFLGSPFGKEVGLQDLISPKEGKQFPILCTDRFVASGMCQVQQALQSLPLLRGVCSVWETIGTPWQ